MQMNQMQAVTVVQEQEKKKGYLIFTVDLVDLNSDGNDHERKLLGNLLCLSRFVNSSSNK